MTEAMSLIVDGEVERSLKLAAHDLRSYPGQVAMGDIEPRKAGQVAVKLQDVLVACGMKQTATHLGLHGTRDDFHASIPLEPVIDRGLIIFEQDGASLAVEAGGPFRFYIPNHAACQMDEIDECANVKFLDRIELTAGRGFDNRPQDEDEHERLHRRQAEGE